MTVHTFFFLCADLPPYMNTSLISFQIASKPSAIPIPFQYLFAILTGYAVVIAYSFLVFTIHISMLVYFLLMKKFRIFKDIADDFDLFSTQIPPV
jgi:hypothetical protein